MNRVKPAMRELQIYALQFKCPGCDDWHSIYVADGMRQGPSWKWNGNLERPSFQPSLLVRSGHHVDGKHPCWCDYRKEHPEKNAPTCYICHSFITDGRIQFLSDCTHSMAGQTIELPLLT